VSTCKWTTTADEIAALSITTSGTTTLKIYDINEIPDAIDQRFCPQMFPDAGNFVTDFECIRSTMGPAAAAMHTFRYRLNYIVAVMPAGSTRGLKDIYGVMVDVGEDIIKKVSETDDAFTVANIEPGPIGAFGLVSDASGMQFHGFNISFNCEEFE
jgi:hypothetical protein